MLDTKSPTKGLTVQLGEIVNPDSARVEAHMKEWPEDIRASYQHLKLLLEEHGADLRMPHSRSMGSGLFELRAKGKEGIGRAFYCFQVGQRIVILHGYHTR